jgi:cytochrome c oxidase subunit 2
MNRIGMDDGPRARRRQAWCARLATVLLVLLPGCQGVQSALDPAGGDAQRILVLTNLLFVAGVLIFVLVMGLLLYAMYVPPERRAWLGRRSTVIYGGIVFPTVVLSASLPYGLAVMRDTDVARPGALRIEVVGEQYWWRVHYPAEGDQPAFTTANEVQIPLGRPISVVVTSGDVIHSFWIPNLAGKVDMIPGRINRLHFSAERPGVYRGVCTEFCGDQHARMAFDVVVLDPGDFDRWRARQAALAEAPVTPVLQRGRELFVRGGCGNCHAVRGTDSEGQLGPDLTHVGSRRSLGGAQFPNNVGTLGGWVANTQHLKPGARMPSYGSFAGEDLRAIASYLESLR